MVNAVTLLAVLVGLSGNEHRFRRAISVNFARSIGNVFLEVVGWTSLVKVQGIAAGTGDYVTSSPFDILLELPNVLALVRPRNRFFRSWVILGAWLRLLTFFVVSQHIAEPLLPIFYALPSLAPIILVSIFIFIPIVQVRDVVSDAVVVDTFDLFFGGTLFENDDTWRHYDWLDKAFAYATVLLFTLGFLNVFIAIVTDSYATQKAKFESNFIASRAWICRTYFLRVDTFNRLLGESTVPDPAIAACLLGPVAVLLVIILSQVPRDINFVIPIAILAHLVIWIAALAKAGPLSIDCQADSQADQPSRVAEEDSDPPERHPKDQTDHASRVAQDKAGLGSKENQPPRFIWFACRPEKLSEIGDEY